VGESEDREKSERHKVILIQFLELQTTKHQPQPLFHQNVSWTKVIVCSDKTVRVTAFGQVNGLHKTQGLNQIKGV